jgi:DnaJ-class molecular chaperone
MNGVDINKDYYDVLFLKRDCLQESVRKSYRKLSFKYHPDRNSSEEAAKKFQKINEAYEVLYDTEKRRYYDKNSPYGNSYDYQNHTTHTRTDFSSKVNADFQDKEKYFTKTDIKRSVTITFEEYYKGSPLNVSYYRLMRCDDCSGYGNDSSGGIECAMCDGTGQARFTLDSKAGKCQMCGGRKYISTDPCPSCGGKGIYEKKQVIRLDKLYRFNPGERYNQEYSKGGNYHRGKNKYGTFFLIIDVESDPRYKIDENNILHRKIDVHFQDAIDGNKIDYSHVDGKTYRIDLNANTRDGDVIKLPKKGIKEGKSRNDLHLHINIIIDYDRL